MFRFFLHCLLSNRKPPIARDPYSFGRRDHRLGCGPLLELAMRAGRRRRSGFPRESDDSESLYGSYSAGRLAAVVRKKLLFRSVPVNLLST